MTKPNYKSQVKYLVNVLEDIATAMDELCGDTDPDCAVSLWKEEYPMLWVCYRANKAIMHVKPRYSKNA